MKIRIFCPEGFMAKREMAVPFNLEEELKKRGAKRRMCEKTDAGVLAKPYEAAAILGKWARPALERPAENIC